MSPLNHQAKEAVPSREAVTLFAPSIVVPSVAAAKTALATRSDCWLLAAPWTNGSSALGHVAFGITSKDMRLKVGPEGVGVGVDRENCVTTTARIKSGKQIVLHF